MPRIATYSDLHDSTRMMDNDFANAHLSYLPQRMEPSSEGTALRRNKTGHKGRSGPDWAVVVSGRKDCSPWQAVVCTQTCWCH